MLDALTRLLKKKTVLAGLAVVLVGGTYWYVQHSAAATPTQYVLSPVSRGTVVVSVSGSGQVSDQNQLDIKPKVSGTVMRVLVKEGQAVKAGEPLFQIDKTDAQKTLRDASQALNDARISLQSAIISYNKLKEPPDPVALVQAQDALNQANRNLQKLQQPVDPNDLAQAQAELQTQQQNIQISSDGINPNVIRNAYDNAVPLLKTVTQALQQSLYDADSILGIDNLNANISFKNLLSALDSSKLLNANALYPKTKAAIAALKIETDALQATNQDTASIDKALADSQATVDLMDPLLQNTYEALLDTLTSSSFSQSSLTTLQNMIEGDRTDVASRLTSLVNQVQVLSQAKTSFLTAQLNVQKAQDALQKLQEPPDPKDVAADEESVVEAQKALDKLKQGTDPVDLQLAQNTIAQRQSAVQEAASKVSDAQQALNDYTIVALFDGTVAHIQAQTGGQASAGTAMATLLTKQQTAQITLNEVDASKLQVGQKATLTFTALPDLTIAAAVSEIDPLGTVSQGVVSYNVVIAFDAPNDLVKPGMSVTAAIVTQVAADVLVVPNAALHSSGNATTVQTLKSPVAVGDPANATYTTTSPVQSLPVTVGLANDQQTEIVQGINEGDSIVVRTIVPSAAKPATTAVPTSALRGVGGLTGGGGGFGGGAGR